MPSPLPLSESAGQRIPRTSRGPYCHATH